MNSESKKKLSSIKGLFYIITGILSAGFGLKGFVLPNNFIDGGVTGVSILLSKLTDIPLPFLLVLVNTPFILLGYKQLGFKFAIHSIIAIVGLAFAITFIDYPIITTDKLLVSVFGGVFLGAGIGLAVRGSTVLDGTEILAIYLSRKTRQRIGDIILLFNIGSSLLLLTFSQLKQHSTQFSFIYLLQKRLILSSKELKNILLLQFFLLKMKKYV